MGSVDSVDSVDPNFTSESTTAKLSKMNYIMTHVRLQCLVDWMPIQVPNHPIEVNDLHLRAWPHGPMAPRAPRLAGFQPGLGPTRHYGAGSHHSCRTTRNQWSPTIRDRPVELMQGLVLNLENVKKRCKLRRILCIFKKTLFTLASGLDDGPLCLKRLGLVAVAICDHPPRLLQYNKAVHL